jgi:hypothetical protein
MIKEIFSLVVTLFLIGFISSTCNESQIDINSANASELDKIINVGPKTAEWIIGNRTYNSVDELTKIYGIGDIKIAQIKAQGVACVSEEVKEEINEENITNNTELQETIPEETQEENETTNIGKEEKINNLKIQEIVNTKNNTIIELSPINLNSKDIKSEKDKEILKRRLSLFGLTTLGLVLGVLLLLKSKKNKNEFI